MAGSVARFEDDTRELHRLAAQQAHAVAIDHGGYLRAMYGFHAPLEETFASDTILEAHGFGSRRRAPVLLRELRALGDFAPPVWCTDLPDASTLARRIGIAYVLYGTAWKRFAATAERLLITHAAETDAVIAAQETLSKLIDWLGVSRASRGSATRPSTPGTPAAVR